MLRGPEREWAKTIYQIIDEQRDYLGEWLPWVERTTSLQYIRTFLRESILFNAGGQRFTTFIFYENQLVGSIGFVRVDKQHQCGEIGYWLHRDFQGKGIITKSCRGLIAHGFRVLNLQRIEVRILAGNDSSMPIPLKVGFQHEGTLRAAAKLYEQFYDVNLFGITRKDWESKNL
ncbi:MAG: GNAT family N-acetyltransferase [Saprospiraceae bacterium]